MSKHKPNFLSKPLSADKAAQLSKTIAEFEKQAGAAVQAAPRFFADAGKKLPIETPLQTLKSAAALADAGITEGEVFENVIKAATWHNIGDKVEKVFQEVFAKKAAESSKREEDLEKALEEACALVYRDDTGKLRGCYRIKNASDISYSSDLLADDIIKKRLPSDIARMCARKMVKKAEELGAEDVLHPVVVRLGEERLPDYEFAKEMLPAVCGNPSAAEIGNDIIEAMSAAENRGENPEEFLGLIAALQEAVPVKTDLASLIFSGPRINDIRDEAKNIVIIKNVPVPRQAVLEVAIPEDMLSAQEMMYLAKVLDAIEAGESRLPGLPDYLADILLKALIGKL